LKDGDDWRATHFDGDCRQRSAGGRQPANGASNSGFYQSRSSDFTGYDDSND
jgi:hypothetical protein